MPEGAFTVPKVSVGGQAFEAAGQGRRLRGFNPSRLHVNAAIAKAGPTLLARARWLAENDGYAGNAVDAWAGAAAGDGIKPRPRIRVAATKRAMLDLWWQWTEEADADGMTDFYGLQEKVAREVFLAGECFVRKRYRREGDMLTVPFQLQVYASEMLDVAYDAPLSGGGYIRAGIEFDSIGRRVAYHFWRHHPLDVRVAADVSARERVRVPARDVIHVLDARQAGQIRGVPRVARILIKLFMLEAYDDAELERKKTAALFTAFLVGRGENPLTTDDDEQDVDGGDIAPMTPGGIVDLGDDKDIRFATPAEVGGSYEAFQFRTLMKIAAGLGIPYAILTGDVTRGNFSNVRTAIIDFRRRVTQWQHNTLVFQFCREVWREFVERAVLADFLDLPRYAVNPSPYWACEWLPPRFGWVDPLKDMQAEALAVKEGFKSRSQVIAESGYDREEVDQERAEEAKAARALGVEPGAATGAPSVTGEPMNEDEAAEAQAERDADAAQNTESS